MERTHSFGYWLRRRRKALDLTQTDLARQVNCSAVLIQKIEADERRPSRQLAEHLAERLELDATERDAFIQAARAERTVDDLKVPSAPVEQTHYSIRANLPLQPTALLGRESEVAQVVALLRQPATRVVTITGPGGIGKTRVGLQVAAELAAAFPDGTYFVDLAPIREPALVSGAIGQALGFREIGQHPLLAQLQEFLRDKRLLLLLDNFEQVLDAAPLVAELLAAAGQLKILVTSRAALHLRGEKEFVVPPLALPDRDALPPLGRLAQYAAVALFIERAGDAKRDFQISDANAPAVAEICERLDGLPLAIELAAARVKLFPPEALLARLSSQLALLTGGARDMPARQQTIRDTIAWSYDLLSEPEQSLFRRLGVFVGGWTLEAADVVCAELRMQNEELRNGVNDETIHNSQFSILHSLAALVDKSLVRQVHGVDSEPRFGMLETIREYALEQLEASGEAGAVREQHAHFYVASVPHLPSEDETIWRRRVDPEYDNVLAALAWSQSAAGDPEVAFRLAVPLSDLWFHHGYGEEAITTLERVLSHPRLPEHPAMHIDIHATLAQVYGLCGNYAAAQAHWEQALQIRRALAPSAPQPWVSEAWIVARLGWLAREQGDSATAWSRLSEAMALQRAANDVAGLAWTLNTAAEVAIVDEDPARAEALLAESQALGLDNGWEWHTGWEGWTLNHLGHAAQLRGAYQRAAQLHHESLECFQALGEQNWGLLWAYHSLGETALASGQLNEAARWLALGLTKSRRLSDQASLAWCLAGMGSAAALDEEPERAARLWGAAERLRQAIGCRPAPAARATYERALANARAQLDENSFAAAWAAGEKLTLEQAMAEALGDRA